MDIIERNGVNIATLTDGNKVLLGMEAKALQDHCKRHPEVATSPTDYLHKAYEILTNGKPYKGGNLNKGFFARAFDSQELGMPVLVTAYQRFK